MSDVDVIYIPRDEDDGFTAYCASIRSADVVRVYTSAPVLLGSAEYRDYYPSLDYAYTTGVQTNLGGGLFGGLGSLLSLDIDLLGLVNVDLDLLSGSQRADYDSWYETQCHEVSQSVLEIPAQYIGGVFSVAIFAMLAIWLITKNTFKYFYKGWAV